jgi:RNA polymerase sigma-70 factor (ECF subfamily)
MDTYTSRSEEDMIIEKYKNTVYAIALTHTKNRFDADDVFQEVFLAYFKKERTYKDEEHRKAWFIRCALNLSKKNYNSSIWRRAASLSEADDAFIFEDERENELFSALRSLPEKLRSPVYLFYFEDMKTKDIARLLKVSDATVRMRLSRAREKLRNILVGGTTSE